MLRTLLRYILLTFVGILGFLIIFVLISVAPVDRTPAEDISSYNGMLTRLEQLQIEIPPAREGFQAGFAKVNITPSKPVATAGYGKRRGKPYETVHDSIFVRSMVITNGQAKVAVVSADLLLMPPTVTKLLGEKLSAIGFNLDNTYLSATHSHNSIGHWGEGATRFIYGVYEDSLVNFIADGIVKSIGMANADLQPSTLLNGVISIPDAVENRLIDGGKEDPYLRVLEVVQEDSSRNVLVSYPAHATCLFQRTLALSRDYPGMLVDALEERGYRFAMFLAGAVGSHKGSSPEDNWGCVTWMSNYIAESFLSQQSALAEMQDSTLVMERIALPLSDPQVKIAEDWKIRPWLFRAAFGEYDSFLTVLRIGDLVMLGTPCDFSGEFSASLDSTARQLNVDAMVTSFNGGYIGYVTPGAYYDIDHYETQLMNWYAPGTGEYIRDCLRHLMTEVSDTR